MPLFQGIPPFAGEGIASGQALQAAYWDLKNQIAAILVSSGTLAATLTLGNDAGGQNATNFGDISLAGTLYDEGGLGFGILTAGALTMTVATASTWTFNANLTIVGSVIDATATGGILLPNGTAGAVAIGNAADNGLMFGANTVSISTNGVEKWMVNSSGSLNPILDNTYDIGNGAVNPRDVNVSRDVVVGGKLLTNFIEDNGANIEINQLLAGGKITMTTLDDTINLTSGTDINVQAGVGSAIYLTAGAGGTIRATSDDGVILLTPDTGWTACTGTENKAGLDSNNVIFTVGALQDLARTVAALQNSFMTKGYLVA